MNRTSTKSDLLRYAYNETNLKDADRIQRTIDGDPLVQQEYNEIHEVLGALDEGKSEPSDDSVKKILERAKKI